MCPKNFGPRSNATFKNLPPNKRLKLTGHSSLQISVLPSGHETRRFQLPGHRGRQLSREPLGGREAVANLVNRVLWWALVVSLLVYIVVAHVSNVPPNPDAQIALLTPVFVLLSVGVGVGTVIYRRHALARPIQSGKLDPTTPDGAQRAFQPFITNLVLSESVGIYGLVLAFLSGNPIFSIAFSGAAIVLMFLHRPTAPDLAPPLSARQRGTDSSPIV